MANLVDITSSNWSDEVAKSSDRVIVVCWADWSGPSKRLMPTMYDLADSSSAKFGRIDVDAESSLAQTLNLTSVPQVLDLQKGQVQNRIIGAQTKAYYQRTLDL